MLTGRGTSALSLLVVMATASSASTALSCRSKTSEALDASSDGGSESGADDAATGVTGATAPGAIDAGAQAAPTASSLFSNLPPPTPFAGNYRCFKNGLHLDQSGSLVMSTMHKDGTTDTIIACTAFGDTCTGTVRDIHLVKSKTGKKVDAVRPITLLRTKGGDVIVKLGHEQKPAGAKSTSSSSSRAAAGDETFCPRR